MKLLRKLDDSSPGSSGEVKLLPMDADDMWNLYNLIAIGDTVSSKTTRKVVNTTSTGATKSSDRVTINKLSVVVHSIDWDGSTNQIRVSGTVPDSQGGRAADYVKHGQFHTLQLEACNDIYLAKNVWESIDIDLLNTATSNFRDVSAAALVMHMGLAHVCLITRTMCPTVAKIEHSIPKKRAINNQQSAITKFYTKIADSLVVLPKSITCFIIAAPAYVGTEFYDFLTKNYAEEYKWLFPLVRSMHATSGHKHALLEALSDGSLSSILTDSGLDIERKTMTEFLSLLNSHPLQAYYGINDITSIVTDYSGSIKSLMISDKLFKCEDPLERKKYIQIVESVKQNGGQAIIFSSLNPTCEQLDQLTGIACTLLYDVDDLHNDNELIALEHFIDAALELSPLDIPYTNETYSSITHSIDTEGFDMFICSSLNCDDMNQMNPDRIKSTSGAAFTTPEMSAKVNETKKETKRDSKKNNDKDEAGSKKDHKKSSNNPPTAKDSKDSGSKADKKSKKKEGGGDDDRYADLGGLF